jgi:hypothetical protein
MTCTVEPGKRECDTSCRHYKTCIHGEKKGRHDGTDIERK